MPAPRPARIGKSQAEDTASIGRTWTKISAQKDSCEGPRPRITLCASSAAGLKTVVIKLRADADLRSGSRSHRLTARALTRKAGAHGLVWRPRPSACPALPRQKKHDPYP